MLPTTDEDPMELRPFVAIAGCCALAACGLDVVGTAVPMDADASSDARHADNRSPVDAVGPTSADAQADPDTDAGRASCAALCPGLGGTCSGGTCMITCTRCTEIACPAGLACGFVCADPKGCLGGPHG